MQNERLTSGPPDQRDLMAVVVSVADALEQLFASTFSNPDDALCFVPELLALVASDNGAASADDLAAPPGDAFAAALRAAGANAETFGQALTAALDEGLPVAARVPGGRELFAMFAAGAHAIPGGAAAVDRYISRRRRDPEARRWGARVRALVREDRIPLRALRPHAPRRGVARRTPRRQSHHRARTFSRAGPQDGPAPSEPHCADARTLSAAPSLHLPQCAKACGRKIPPATLPNRGPRDLLSDEVSLAAKTSTRPPPRSLSRINKTRHCLVRTSPSVRGPPYRLSRLIDTTWPAYRSR
jgi:hypothetical protein